MPKINSKKIIFFICASAVFIIDQLTKKAVDTFLSLGRIEEIIPGVISFVKVFNTGAAFGIMQDGRIWLILLSVAVLAGILFHILKFSDRFSLPIVVFWGIVAGGITGNLTDRIFHGYVTDFIKPDFVNFPVFNIADISINIGVFLIILFSVLKKNSSESPE